ncbi:MAG: 8-oxoguanine DNA glycosylase [Pedosphaera sp.]|nr:8-oxoguanine DNA glycosylase [Pedosphaera sp.]MSS99936.1 8-oxoguanine DNA glycosylase [Pedosphaera sp.]
MMIELGCQHRFAVRDYDLAATLGCGQAFRWRERNGVWEGVVDGRWVSLRQPDEGSILALTAAPQADWDWLADHLQTTVDLSAVLATFPDDAPMRAAVAHGRGLRLLQQEPWECLASFICSSTKRIVQIQQIIALLSERLGEPVAVPHGHAPAFAFPSPERLAAASEAELRLCKMGFRAPNLRNAALQVSSGGLRLVDLHSHSCAIARVELEKLPGVGRKIADCVLLFAYGFQQAFPVDVWVMKALRQLYFPRRRPTPQRLRSFSETHFGANAGYAQQYLFHYMRTRGRRKK